MCNHITFIYSTYIFDKVFDIMLNERFICNNLIKLCDDEPHKTNFRDLNEEQFFKIVLMGKPKGTEEYLNKLYERIDSEEDNARETYRVL